MEPLDERGARHQRQRSAALHMVIKQEAKNRAWISQEGGTDVQAQELPLACNIYANQ